MGFNLAFKGLNKRESCLKKVSTWNQICQCEQKIPKGMTASKQWSNSTQRSQWFGHQI